MSGHSSTCAARISCCRRAKRCIGTARRPGSIFLLRSRPAASPWKRAPPFCAAGMWPTGTNGKMCIRDSPHRHPLRTDLPYHALRINGTRKVQGKILKPHAAAVRDAAREHLCVKDPPAASAVQCKIAKALQQQPRRLPAARIVVRDVPPMQRQALRVKVIYPRPVSYTHLGPHCRLPEGGAFRRLVLPPPHRAGGKFLFLFRRTDFAASPDGGDLYDGQPISRHARLPAPEGNALRRRGLWLSAGIPRLPDAGEERKHKRGGDAGARVPRVR